MPAFIRRTWVRVPSVSPGVTQAAASESNDDSVEIPDPAAEMGYGGDPGGPSPGQDDGDGPPVAKRKTRRGSRGGRSRSKKPAALGAEGIADAATDAGAEPETGLSEGGVEEVDSVIATPAISVSETETLTVKNGPMVVAAERAAETPTPDAPHDNNDEPSEAGYVPMSEWLGDFDRR